MRLSFHRTSQPDRWVIRRMVGKRPLDYLHIAEHGDYRWTKSKKMATQFVSQYLAYKEVFCSDINWKHEVAVERF